MSDPAEKESPGEWKKLNRGQKEVIQQRQYNTKGSIQQWEKIYRSSGNI
jgi:hypothetical protein